MSVRGELGSKRLVRRTCASVLCCVGAACGSVPPLTLPSSSFSLVCACACARCMIMVCVLIDGVAGRCVFSIVGLVVHRRRPCCVIIGV